MITVKCGESACDKASAEDFERAIDDVMARLGTVKLPTRAEFLAWKKQKREDEEFGLYRKCVADVYTKT